LHTRLNGAVILGLLLPFFFIGHSGPHQSEAAAVPWAGAGAYRLLVKVDAQNIGQRRSDAMPAEIVIDFVAELLRVGVHGMVDIGSIQVMKYDPNSGKPERYGDYAYARSPFDRPFRWYDSSIAYDFPEFMGVVDRTDGEIRRANRLRGGYFYNSLGDWKSGHLAWVHTQEGNQPAYYSIYFDPLPANQQPQTSPPSGWLGDGMQRCDRVTDSTTGATQVCVAVDDWDGDGRSDLVFGEDYGHLFWFRNTGTRTAPSFPSYRMVFDADGLPIDVGFGLAPLVVDWDNDGVKDLIVGTHWNRALFFKNLGTNNFRKLAYKGFLKIDGKPLELPISPLKVGSPEVFKEDYYPVFDAVDWDGDGDLDLLAGGYITGRIYYYENTGPGPDGMPLLRFRGPLEADGQPINVGEWCASPCAADFDGDGDLDLISGRFSWSRDKDTEHFLRFYENAGARNRPLLKEKPFPREGTPPTLNLSVPRALDWDGDGDLDLVVSSGSNIYLYENIGTKTSPKFRVHDKPLPSAWGRSDLPGTGAYTSTQFMDWNGDGFLDVISGYTIRLNAGKGNPGVYQAGVPLLPPGEYISHPSGIGDDWFWPRLYDFDRDGKLDVLFGDWGGQVWFHRNLSTPEKPHFDVTGSKLRMLDGVEIKVGPIGKDPQKDFSALQGARTVFTVADFDNDGLNDLVVGDTYGIVRYYRNAGTNQRPLFASPAQIADTKSRGMVDAVDWNKDGRTDVLVGTSAGTVLVFLNTGTRGDARFAPGFELAIPPIIEPRAIAVDLNGDGDDDLFIPGTQGSCFVERSFLEHGYARGQLLKMEKKH